MLYTTLVKPCSGLSKEDRRLEALGKTASIKALMNTMQSTLPLSPIFMTVAKMALQFCSPVVDSKDMQHHRSSTKWEGGKNVPMNVQINFGFFSPPLLLLTESDKHSVA